MNVFILATCRSEDLLPATTLVFQTLRTGFPTAHVGVFVNHLPNVACEKVLLAAMEKARVDDIGIEPGETWEQREPTTQHHIWIRDLITRETEPFWLLDTDLAFWSKVEDFDFGMAAMAGRLVPQFHCAFANAVTMARLHTCALFVNPVRLKASIEAYGKQFPSCYCTPRPSLEDLVYPRYVPLRVGSKKQSFFYDTCAGLHHTCGGLPFTDAQNAAFDHLNFGTLSDQVAPSYPDQKFREGHFAIFESIELLRGAWQDQQRFYAERAV